MGSSPEHLLSKAAHGRGDETTTYCSHPSADIDVWPRACLLAPVAQAEGADMMLRNMPRACPLYLANFAVERPHKPFSLETNGIFRCTSRN